MRSLGENDGLVQFSVARQVVLGFLIRSASTPIDQPRDQFASFDSYSNRYSCDNLIQSDKGRIVVMR